MGWFGRKIKAASPENPSTNLANPDQWLVDWAGAAGMPSFGPMVSERMAMRVSTVFRCVSLISGLVASLPLKIYRLDPATGMKIECPTHRLAPLLSVAPYPGGSMTAFLWREQVKANELLWGNSYSVIRYDNAGRVIGFEHVANPAAVEVRRNGLANTYFVKWSNGSVEVVPQEDMIHVAGPGFDGIVGQSRIQSFARSAVSLASVLEEQTGRVHENAAKPSGMVTLPANIQADGKRRIEQFFRDKFTGRANAGGVLFMDVDSKYTPMQMSPEDLGTLAMRQYQAADICRFYGVPPHLVGEAANTSAWGTGIEQLTIGFTQYTLDPELQRIEHELKLKLFGPSSPYSAEFDRKALSAMDAKTTADVSQTRINSGVLTPNEARRALNLPPKDGGDSLFVNSTMIPIDRATNPPARPHPPRTAPRHEAETFFRARRGSF